MKTKLKYIAWALAPFFMVSCSDFLETPPSVDYGEDEVFSTRADAEKLLTTLYAEGMPYGFCMSSVDTDRRLLSTSTLGSACDEGEEVGLWAKGNQAWNAGNHNNGSFWWDEDCRFYLRNHTTRVANLILNRINDVPYDEGDPDFNKRATGEAYFMRAMLLWEGVYRYGGMPIVREVIAPNDFSERKRNSFSDCIDSILVDCDRATHYLPDYYTDNTKLGRATRIAALALKARVLLYAASPLFNTNKPYMSLPGNEELIGYGNYDKERWKKAADAAKEAIDAAVNSGHYKIHNTGNPETDYEYVWTTPDNEEIILGNMKYRDFRTTDRPLVADLPSWAMSKAWGDAGLYVTFNFVKHYEKRSNGEPADWDMNGGDDLIAIYNSLDPRFKQTVAYHSSSWNDEIPFINFLDGGAQKSPMDRTAHLLHKWVPRILHVDGSNTTNVQWPVFRMAELYLNYAEALNEYYSAPPQEAYDAVSIVRERAGMPAFPAGMSQEAFRTKLRNERSVELAFEDHRFWDIRRWLIAGDEGVMQGKFYGLKIHSIDGNKTHVHYTPYVFENRFWNDNCYLYAINQSEVNKGYLVQNPGW